jgi:carbon monoxide dehydrogenase subunit G
MAHYQTTIEVPARPEEAFRYVADVTNFETWDPGTVQAERLGEGENTPFGVGARYRVVAAFFGRRIDFDYVVEEYDEPRRIVLVGRSKSVTSRDTISIEPSGDGSAITYDAELRLSGAMRVFDKGLQVAFTNIGTRAAEGLRKALGG